MTAPKDNTHIVWVQESLGLGPVGLWARCRLTPQFVMIGATKYRRTYGSLVGSGYLRSSIDIKTLRPLDDEAQRLLDDQSYVWGNSRKIAEAVARITDAGLLRKVAALVGVTP